jgi:hypothetical protein
MLNFYTDYSNNHLMWPWIFDFYTFLADFNPNFKHVVLSHLGELLGQLYIVGKLAMSSL